MDFFLSTACLCNGVGVLFSSVPFLYFKLQLLLLQGMQPTFTDDILGLCNVGGILLIGLGINVLGIKKLRIMNMLPSLVIVILFIWLFK